MLIYLTAAAAGFAVALVCAPVGVSGAVLLLPAQSSLLGLAGPSVSSTNLLFNVISTPGGLHTLRRTPGVTRAEVLTLVAVGVPAAVGGALARVTLLSDADVFRLLVAAAMLPVAATLGWRLWRAQPSAPVAATTAGGRRLRALASLAVVTSFLGAAVGVGGGSLLAPALVAATGRSPQQAAPLALLATLTTSLTGLGAYSALEAVDVGARPASPEWLIGTVTGLGGLAGSRVGAGLQAQLNERVLTGLLACLVTAVAVAQLVR
ncbi:MAG: hypothetical protein K0Q93_2710 [Nocardioidaceae bacterium]|nr:hypothetical protein [Nocardioidaceae bacterium]